MSFAYDSNYFILANPFINKNKELREPQIDGYFHVYDHFMVKKKTTSAIVVLPTGERVIIVTGCINILISRVSGTFIKNNSCIA